MTKRIAGLTGSFCAMIFGMLLILATLVSSESFSFPTPRFANSEPEPAASSDPADVGDPLTAEESAALARLSLPTELVSDPETISGVNASSLFAELYGATTLTAEPEPAKTLTSLVLSQSLPERDLGVFEVTYQMTPEEYDMLLYCIDHETRNGSLTHRILIAEVVFNRVQGPKFGSTVSDVLNAPNQFDVMPGYASRGDWEARDITRQAVDMVLGGTAPDYAQGARYFCNPYIVGEGNWFDTSLETVCELEGHRFYK